MRIIAGIAIVLAVLFGLLYFLPRPPAGRRVDSGTGAPVAPPPVVDASVRQPSPKPADRAAALLRDASAAAREGQWDKARMLYEQVASEFAETWSGREANLELGNIYLREGRKKEALDALKKGLPNAGEDRRLAVTEAIAKLEQELAGKPVEPPAQPDMEDTVYSVRRGDTLASIAARFKVTVEQIKLVNNRTDDRLRIGDPVRVTRSMPAVRISKGHLKLELHFKDKLVKEYPVAIGKDDLTPAGEFVVGNKVKNPPWHRPGSRPIPYGDPRNILGTRWLTLVGADGVQRGYGVHGTTLPESVPGRTSAGCVRMHNSDVEELYEWVPPGSHVTITDD
jgi:LysM repeat protein